MAKILNNAIITTGVHKMIELRKGFLINGQYYLKENMQPVPFNTVTYNDANFTGGNYAFMSLNRNVKYYDSLHHPSNHNNPTLVFDSEDENITFALIESNNHKYLCKYKEENNFCSLLYVSKIADTYGHVKCNSIYEKNGEIRCIFANQGGNTWQERFRKTDLYKLGTYNVDETGGSTSYPYDQYSEIIRTETGIFSYTSAYGQNRYTFFNELNNTRIFQNMIDVDPGYGTSTSCRNRFDFNNLYEKTDTTMSVIHLCLDKTNSVTVNFKTAYKVTLDMDSNSFTREEIKLSVEQDLLDKYKTDFYYSGNYYSSDVWFKEINGKKYMILYHRDFHNANQMSRAYYFEITKALEDDELETTKIHLFKIQEFPLGQVGQIVHFKDEEKIRFYGYTKAGNGVSLLTNLHCYELDEAKLEFKKVFNLDGEIREFGFDINKSLYVLWNTLDVSKFNERTAANFNARFENTMYEYEGEDIATKLIISTTNLEGDLIEKDVTLDLKGNVKFTSNGTKTITLKTSAEAETEVPITITGAGSLSIFPKVKL